MNEAAKEVLGTTAEHFGEKRYPHSVLEGFGNGCLLDLRVRLAVDLLKGPLYANVVAEGVELGTEDNARDIAVHALDVATALMSIAEARGLIEPLPGDDGLDLQCRLQATRTARYGVLQQICQQRVVAEEGSRIQPATGPLGGNGLNG